MLEVVLNASHFTDEKLRKKDVEQNTNKVRRDLLYALSHQYISCTYLLTYLFTHLLRKVTEQDTLGLGHEWLGWQ